MALLLFRPGAGGTPAQALSYTGFVSDVTANKVSTAAITAAGSVSGKLQRRQRLHFPDPGRAERQRPSRPPARAQGPGDGNQREHELGAWASRCWIFPILIIVGLFVWFGRRGSKQLTGRLGGIMAFGKSKARVYDEDRPSTRFADIAGYEGSKAEVMEVVDFLKHPARYDRAGAVGPKGVLMVGPPGTGKTLLARAVAGEAGRAVLLPERL